MSATWLAVARKDVEAAVRSRLLWGLVVAFTGFLLITLPAAEQLFPETETVSAAKALSGVAMLAQLFVPGIGIVAGYMAIVGERRTGSLRVLLSYPFSRFDVVAGKVAGRFVVTATALGAGYVVATVLVVALYGAPDPVTMLGFVGAGVLLGLTFTGLAVGGSAATATRGRAMGLTVGAFATMVLFWKPLLVGLYYVLHGNRPGVQPQTWYLLAKRLNPLESFRVLTTEVLGEHVAAVPRLPLEDIPAEASRTGIPIEQRIAGEVPLYLSEWVAVLVLVAWAVVPLAIGYWRFERTDLG